MCEEGARPSRFARVRLLNMDNSENENDSKSNNSQSGADSSSFDGQGKAAPLPPVVSTVHVYDRRSSSGGTNAGECERELPTRTDKKGD